MGISYHSEDIIQGKYKIIDILGKGGTAITYRAEDILNQRKVAIKILSLHQVMEWKIIELFEREAKVLANLNHPQIPKYIDYFYLDVNNNRIFFLVQELISGNSLADLVKGGRYFQEAGVKDIAKQLLTILEYLHNLEPPVIHRDIKPHNIICSDTGKIYLVDLGAVQDVYRNTLTHSGTFVGTIDYMSPEQMRGQACFASDLYSLGCTLLYLLTRRSPVDLPLQRMKIDFRNLLSISSQFADWLEIIVEPAVENRFQSTQEALTTLNRKSGFQPKILNRKNRKPTGSKVELRKTKDELSIKIHPAILQNYGESHYLYLLVPIILVLILVFFGFNIYNFSLEETDLINLTIVALISHGIPTILIFWGISYFFKTYNLNINRNRFIFECNFLGIKQTFMGKTSSLKRMEIQREYIDNKTGGITISCCAIKRYRSIYLFGSWLTQIEQEWITSEIAEFISEINQLQNQ